MNDDFGNRYKQTKYMQQLKCIQREIDFLRELQFCDNVISLESVYKSIEQQSREFFDFSDNNMTKGGGGA